MVVKQFNVLWLLSGLMLIILLVCFFLWSLLRDERSEWLSTPPAPSKAIAISYGLGDKQFAYRALSLMLQNLGDEGGRVTSLKDYDYVILADWFFLLDELDPQSNFVPALASFYFGAVQIPEKLPPLIEYLRVAGSRQGNEKWRYLAHAIYLARYELQDYDLAYELANELANHKDGNLPAWAYQMPAMVLRASGDKIEAARVMLEVVKSSGEKMEQVELNFMKNFICDALEKHGAADQHEFCQEGKRPEW